MLIHEHVQTAQDFLDESDREFAQNDVLQASEKLWGAASHAVMAIAQHRGWQYRSHRALKNAITLLTNEQDDPLLEYGFAVAEKFHKVFYHDDMEDWEREADRPMVRHFVNRVLALMPPNNENSHGDAQ